MTLNNPNVASETANEERLLDDLVQALFLVTLRQELDKQKEDYETITGDALFNLNKTIGKANRSIESEFGTVKENLETYQQELHDFQDAYRKHQHELIRSLKESHGDVSVLHDNLLRQLTDSWRRNDEKHQIQIGLLNRSLEEIGQLGQKVANFVDRQSDYHATTTRQHQVLNEQLNALQQYVTASTRKTHRLHYCGLAIISVGIAVLAGLRLI